jgi:hypothetical protein
MNVPSLPLQLVRMRLHPHPCYQCCQFLWVEPHLALVMEVRVTGQLVVAQPEDNFAVVAAGGIKAMEYTKEAVETEEKDASCHRAADHFCTDNRNSFLGTLRTRTMSSWKCNGTDSIMGRSSIATDCGTAEIGSQVITIMVPTSTKLGIGVITRSKGGVMVEVVAMIPEGGSRTIAVIVSVLDRGMTVPTVSKEASTQVVREKNMSREYINSTSGAEEML